MQRKRKAMLVLKVIIALLLFGGAAAWVFLDDFSLEGSWGLPLFIAFIIFLVIYIVAKVKQEHRA